MLGEEPVKVWSERREPVVTFVKGLIFPTSPEAIQREVGAWSGWGEREDVRDTLVGAWQAIAASKGV